MATPLLPGDGAWRPCQLASVPCQLATSRREPCGDGSGQQDPLVQSRGSCFDGGRRSSTHEAQSRGSFDPPVCFDGERLRSEFLESNKDSYGYPGVEGMDFDAFCRDEFPQLRGRAYLDYAGAAPVSQSQLKAAFSALSSTLFTNPHTHADLSLSTSTGEAIAELRLQVLGLLNASPEEYCCIFTSGATAGMQLIAHSFPWQQGSRFAYTLENHNSVLGIRESALAAGASATAVEVHECPREAGDRGTSAGACDSCHSACDSSCGGTCSWRRACTRESASLDSCAGSSRRANSSSTRDTSSGRDTGCTHARARDTITGCPGAGGLTVRGHMCAMDTSTLSWQERGGQQRQQEQQQQGQDKQGGGDRQQPQRHPEGHPQGRAQGRAQEQPQAQVQGQAQGSAQGQAQGREQGLAQGQAQGREQGLAQGQAQGREQGLAQGQAQGRTERRLEQEKVGPVPCLFAMPAECNFSGRKPVLSLVRRIRTGAQEIPGGCLQCTPIGGSCPGCTPSVPLAGSGQDLGEGRPQGAAYAQEKGGRSGKEAAWAQEREGSSAQDSKREKGSIRDGACAQEEGRRGERWYVLLDAAKACSTAPPDLSRCAPDFVTLSFYKICGYPSGLGALVARRDALGGLRKRYFGGGTVAASAAESAFFRRKEAPEEWFEDGTPPFLDIVAALPPGLALLRRLGFPAIARHSLSLACFTAQHLASLTHHNGAPVCQLYSRFPSTKPTSHRASGPAKVHPCDTDRAPGAPEACPCSAGSVGSALPVAPEPYPRKAQDSTSVGGAHSCNSHHSTAPAVCLCGRCHCRPGPKEREARPGVGPATATAISAENAKQGGTVSPPSSSCLQDAQKGSTVTRSALVEAGEGPTVTSSASEEAREGPTVTASALASQQGPTVTFNLRRADGSYVGHREVAKMAELHSLVLRTGSFCNPGASTKHLGVSLEDRLALAEVGGACWDDHDLRQGRPMGAVRASFGYASRLDDALALLRFVHECFVQKGSPVEGRPAWRPGEAGLERPFPAEGRPVEGARAPPVEERRAPLERARALPAAGRPVEKARALSAEGHSAPVEGARARPAEAGSEEVFHECAEEFPDSEETPGEAEHDRQPIPWQEESSGDSQETPGTPGGSRGIPGGTRGTPGAARGTPGGLRALVPCPPPQRDSPVPPSPRLHSRTPRLNALSQHRRVPPTLGALPAPGLRLPSSSARTPGRRLARIDALYVYPIKSCGPMEVSRWPLGPNGLLFDREWALVDAAGAPLKSRRHPGMYLLRPSVDLQARTLTVTSPSMEAPLIVTLEPGLQSQIGKGQRRHPGQGQGQGQAQAYRETLREAQGEGGGGAGGGDEDGGEPMVHQEGLTLCGDRVAGLRYARAEVSAWLSRALGVPCSLVRQVSGARCVKRPSANAGLHQIPGGAVHQQASADAKECSPPAGFQQILRGAVQQQASTDAVQPCFPDSTVQLQVSTLAGQQQGGGGAAEQPALPNRGSDVKAPLAPDALGFANEGQFLVVSQASVQDLNGRLLQSHTRALREGGMNGAGERQQGGSEGGRGGLNVGTGAEPGGGPLQVCALRFRPNVVVSGPGLRPFEEETWKALRVQPQGGVPTVYQGHATPLAHLGYATRGEALGCKGQGSGAQRQEVTLVSRGGCSRCAMVNLDPNTGGSSGLEPLRTLSQYRRDKSKIMFGVLFGREAMGALNGDREPSFGVGDMLEIEE